MNQSSCESVSDASAQAPAHGMTVQNVSAWVLRIGVVSSVAIMLIGTIVSFVHRAPDIERMVHSTFDYHPAVIWQGLRAGRGKSIIEIGIYVLVLTPVTRVFMSMLLFIFEEHDWLYAVVTLAVLLLTLTGLLFLK